MNRFKLFLIIILVVFSAVFLIRRYYLSPSAATLKTDQDADTGQTSDLPANQISSSDLSIYKNKLMSDLESKPAQVSVSMRVVEKTENKSKVEITFNGDPGTNLYAADIVLKVPKESVESMQTVGGSVFPHYPRIYYDGNSIVVTGAAVISQDLINFGQPGKVFCTIIFQKNPQFAGQIEISLDVDRSSIFYQSQNILDFKSSVSKIII